MNSGDAKRGLLSKKSQVRIFRRDHWLCYWCKRPVIFAPVMKCLELEIRKVGHCEPVAYYHAHWTRDTAPLLDELGAVLDHTKPFSSGGACNEDNLVTACNKCNGRKGSMSKDRWIQRPKRNPIKGKYGEPQIWDGLSALFMVFAQRNVAALTAGEKGWLKALTIEQS